MEGHYIILHSQLYYLIAVRTYDIMRVTLVLIGMSAFLLAGIFVHNTIIMTEKFS